MSETLMRLVREHTEALSRLAGSQGIIATEVAAAAVNRIEIAKTLVLLAERLDRTEEDSRTRTAIAVTDLKAHISAEMQMMTVATSAALAAQGAVTAQAIKGTATPRLVGWLIAGAALVIAAALGTMVVKDTHPDRTVHEAQP